MKKFIGSVSLLLLGLGWMWAIPIFSPENPIPPQDREEWHPFPGFFNPRIILEMEQALQLTPKQSSRISDSILAFEENSIRNLAELKIRELRLAAFIRNPEVSRNQVRNAVQEIGRIHTRLFLKFLSTWLDIRDELTPIQKARLSSLRKERQRVLTRRQP